MATFDVNTQVRKVTATKQMALTLILTLHFK